MRICAVNLPELRIELVREQGSQDVGRLLPGDSRTPLAVVVAPAPMTEAKLLGNTRLSVVSREARALGVQPGQTIAQARARAGDLAVRVVRPDAVRDVLARIAEVGLAFGATVSFAMDGDAAKSGGKGDKRDKRGVRDPRGLGKEKSPPTDDFRAPPSTFGDVVWIDITGCAHLHTPASQHAVGRPTSIFDGETILASRLAGAIASLGHTCSVAIADGPRVAAMLARTAAEAGLRARARAQSHRRSQEIESGEPIVVRSGDNAQAIASLPVSSLPLSAEDVRWLAKVGVRTIAEMRALPRDGLGIRLGAGARDILSLIDGDDRAPLASYIPPEVPEEEAELEYGVEGTQALTFVAKTLTDRLAARLQGRAVAAARVELELHLDAAMLRDGGLGRSAHDRGLGRSAQRDAGPALSERLGPPDSSKDGDSAPSSSSRRDKIHLETIALDLPAPLSTAGDLLAALRPKIERLVLAAPVLGAKLRAPVLVHKRAAALSLFEPQPKAERALPRLVAELVSDLGPEAVSTLVLGDSWVPEERSRLVTFGSVKNGKTRARRMLSSVPEPTRLLAEPRALPRASASRESLRITRHLSRVAAVEWWKAVPGQARSGALDYVQAWTDDGAAWIEIERTPSNTTASMRIRGWFD